MASWQLSEGRAGMSRAQQQAPYRKRVPIGSMSSKKTKEANIQASDSFKDHGLRSSWEENQETGSWQPLWTRPGQVI